MHCSTATVCFRALISLSAIGWLVGCVPHVGHGPRVEPGTRYEFESGLVLANELQDEWVTLLPTAYLGASGGWIASDSGPAFSVGFQVPLHLMPFVLLQLADEQTLLAMSYLDVYAQPRRSPNGEFDYGIGGLLSRGFLMPYIQAGRSTGGGAYTTQGIASTCGPLNELFGRERPCWLPAIAFRSVRPDGRRASSFYMNAAIELDSSDPSWFVGFGVLVEFLRK